MKDFLIIRLPSFEKASAQERPPQQNTPIAREAVRRDYLGEGQILDQPQTFQVAPNLPRFRPPTNRL